VCLYAMVYIVTVMYNTPKLYIIHEKYIERNYTNYVVFYSIIIYTNGKICMLQFRLVQLAPYLGKL